MFLFILQLVVLPLLTLSCPPVLERGLRGLRETPQEYFLPKNVKPYRYNIVIEPNLGEATIEGSVEIELLALENSSNITIQVRSVDIEDSNVEVILNEDGSEVKQGDSYWNHDIEHYVIRLVDELKKDKNYTLKIGKYFGKLHTDNGGFYLAKYLDENGVERRLATTHFQSTNARRAFPCFDEPALKATFIVNIVRPENYISISNELLEKSSKYDVGQFIDTYKETVKMSTYLVALVVSDFTYIENGKQKVYARPQAINEGLGNYALWAGVEILNNLEIFLQNEYTPSKLDQIAIPDDYFASGAMENWGLVTYRESNLLYSENFSTTSELQKVLTVIAHEYAHQWFGNLVTLAWWEYLWLNEGFATYFQYETAGELEPEWRLMEQFIPAAVQYALQYDSSESTEAMNYATPSPGGGAPTYVSYQKGGAVVRMFEHFLTTQNFKAGLNHYLHYREYNAAVPDDLYYSLQVKLEEAEQLDLLGGHNVSTILKSWDSFKGYPVVTVERNYESGHINLTQEHFFQKNTTTVDNHTWYIPINFAFSSEGFDFNTTTTDYWFIEEEETIESYNFTEGFVIANKQQTGFYRVNYDETNWKRIIQYLNSETFEQIHVLNRAQLLDDAFDLARSGQLSYEIALELSVFLERETDFIVWYAFLDTLDFLDNALSANASYEDFKQYILILSRKLYSTLTSEESVSDSHLTKLSRSMILPYLCRYGHEECRKAAVNSLQKWVKDDEQMVPPNLQAAFFCAAIAEGNEEDWNFLYSKYYETPQTRSNQRSRIISGLGCSNNKSVLHNYMALAINSSSALESKHRISVLSSIYKSGPFGLTTAFDYVKENFNDVKTSGYLSTILSGVGSLFTTKAQLEQLKALAEEHSQEASLFFSAISSAEENIEWGESKIAAISSWLEARIDNGAAKPIFNVIYTLTVLLLTTLLQ